VRAEHAPVLVHVLNFDHSFHQSSGLSKIMPIVQAVTITISIISFPPYPPRS
jgi:hypothetical protein